MKIPFSKIVLFLTLSFIGGVFISSFFNIPKFLFLEIIFLGIFYGIVLRKNKTVLIFAFCLVFLGLGIWRTEAVKISGTKNFFQGEIQEAVFSFKGKIKGFIYQSFSSPHSSVLEAFVSGNSKEMPKEWKERFNKSGISHIIAVSGMHIVILLGLISALLVFLGFSRMFSLCFSLIFIWIFIILVEFQPSAVRAGIMGSIFILCQAIGRRTSSTRVLFLSAGIMLAQSPLILKESVSFQLSFLATMGLIYLMPMINEKIFHSRSVFKPLTDLLSMTFSAQIFAFPILAFNFGNVSLISPIANLLIVPIVPCAIITGIIFILTSFLFFNLAWLFSFPAWLSVSYILAAARFFSKMPFSATSIKFPWFLIPVYYIVLFLFLSILNKKRKKGLLPV